MIRCGRFRIDHSLVYDDPELVRTILRDCIVVRAESLYFPRCIEYMALHPAFDEIKPGDITPTYVCEMTRHADASLTTRWIRQP
jgi:hypothetical protein